MLKEYRICMPISVEEYHIGQLYMIARHSNEESNDSDGVEVIYNEPCNNDTYGDGQFTEKRIHLSGKLPGWIRAYIPRFIYLTEKAWNYYPYTETEYTCSVVPRFSVKIKTKYQNNKGTSENCLEVSDEELKNRVVDHVDILTDPLEEKHYNEKEDLSLFKSVKTGRGPLHEGWRDVSSIIMCSYKLVDVSFHVFGLQTKVEQFVHNAIRNVLLLGHRQAFAWIDEWYDMTLDDVRQYESGMIEDTNAKIKQHTDKIQEDQDKTTLAGQNEEEEEEEDSETKKASEASKSGEAKSGKKPLKKLGSTASQKSGCSEASEASKNSPTSPSKQGYLASWFKWS